MDLSFNVMENNYAKDLCSDREVHSVALSQTKQAHTLTKGVAVLV